MYNFIDTTNLRKVDTQKDADIYQLQSDDFINRYYIVSSEGTRRYVCTVSGRDWHQYVSRSKDN